MHRHYDLSEGYASDRSIRSVCIATIAVGSEYRTLALRLIQDVSEYCPGVRVLVLTDDASIADGSSNVTALQFRHPGFWYLYYAKIDAIRAALRDHDVCIFLDADCRLLAPPPIDRISQLSPGAYASYVQPVPYKVAGDHARFVARGGRERWLRNSPKRQEQLYRRLGNTFDIDIAQCTFLHESSLVFVKDAATPLLLDLWQFLGKAASCRLLEWGEGYTLGMALHRLNLASGSAPDIEQWLFKDLLSGRQADSDPRVTELLNERRALATSSKSHRLQKASRLLQGLGRYLRAAPLWFAVAERRERDRICRLLS